MAIPRAFTPKSNPSASATGHALAARRILMVSPTFNERSNIEELASRVFAAVPDAHLLIVDDASPDGTAERCRELAASYPGLLLLERQGARGLGLAYIAGMRYGLERDYQVIGTMDADLSHNPAHLPAMVAQSAAHDVVIGSRYVRDGGTINWRLRRIVLSWLANRFAAWLFRIPTHDATSGYRLYRREVLERIGLEQVVSTGYSFLVELLHRANKLGCSIAESPIVYYDRTLGQSKLGAKEIYVGALHLLRLRASRLSFPATQPAASTTKVAE